MPAVYPASLPVRPAAGVNLSTNPHSSLHNNLYDEIVAMATELGTNPKGTSVSVKAKLDLLEVGAWTAYTPVINQGVSTNIAKTINYSKFTRIGRMITYTFHLVLTAAGSAAAGAAITLPVIAANSSGVVGTGVILDNSVALRYAGTWLGITTSTIMFVSDVTNGDVWGAVPNVALATADQLQGSITYEAAT